MSTHFYDVQSIESWTPFQKSIWRFIKNKSYDLKLFFLYFPDPFAVIEFGGVNQLYECLLTLLDRLYTNYPNYNLLSGNWGYVTLCLNTQGISGEYIYRSFLNLQESQYLQSWMKKFTCDIEKKNFTEYLVNQQHLYIYQSSLEALLIEEFELNIEEQMNYLSVVGGVMNPKLIKQEEFQCKKEEEFNQKERKEKYIFSNPIFLDDFESQPQMPRPASVDISEYQSIDLQHEQYNYDEIQPNQFSRHNIQDTKKIEHQELFSINDSITSASQIPQWQKGQEFFRKNREQSGTPKKKQIKRKIKTNYDIQSSIRDYQQKQNFQQAHEKILKKESKIKKVIGVNVKFSQIKLEQFLQLDRAQYLKTKNRDPFKNLKTKQNHYLERRRQDYLQNDYQNKLKKQKRSEKIKLKKVEAPLSYISVISNYLGEKVQKTQPQPQLVIKKQEHEQIFMKNENYQTKKKKITFSDKKYRKKIENFLTQIESNQWVLDNLDANICIEEYDKFERFLQKCQKTKCHPIQNKDYSVLKELRNIMKELNSKIPPVLCDSVTIQEREFIHSKVKEFNMIQKNLSTVYEINNNEQIIQNGIIRKILKNTTIDRIELFLDYLIQFFYIEVSKLNLSISNLNEFDLLKFIDLIKPIVSSFCLIKRLEITSNISLNTANLNIYDLQIKCTQCLQQLKMLLNDLNSKLDFHALQIFIWYPFYADENKWRKDFQISLALKILTKNILRSLFPLQYQLNNIGMSNQNLFNGQVIHWLNYLNNKIDLIDKGMPIETLIKKIFRKVSQIIQHSLKKKVNFKNILLESLQFYTQQNGVEISEIDNIYQFLNQFIVDWIYYFKRIIMPGYFWSQISYLVLLKYITQQNTIDQQVNQQQFTVKLCFDEQIDRRQHDTVSYNNEIKNHFLLIPKLFTEQSEQIKKTMFMFKLLCKNHQNKSQQLDQFFFLIRTINKHILNHKTENLQQLMKIYKQINNFNEFTQEEKLYEALYIIEIINIFEICLNDMMQYTLEQSVDQRTFKRILSRVLPEIQIKDFNQNPLHFIQNMSLIKYFLKFRVQQQFKLGIQNDQKLKLFVQNPQIQFVPQKIQIIIFQEIIDFINFVNNEITILKSKNIEKFYENIYDQQEQILQILLQIIEIQISIWEDSRKYHLIKSWQEKQNILNEADEQDDILADFFKALANQTQNNIIFQSFLLKNIKRLKICVEKDFYTSSFYMKESVRKSIIIFFTNLIVDSSEKSKQIVNKFEEETQLEDIIKKQECEQMKRQFQKHNVNIYSTQIFTHLIQVFLPWCYESLKQQKLEHPQYCIKETTVKLILNVTVELLSMTLMEPTEFQFNKATLFWFQYLSVHGQFINGNLYIFDDWQIFDLKIMDNNQKIDYLDNYLYSRLFYRIVGQNHNIPIIQSKNLLFLIEQYYDFICSSLMKNQTVNGFNILNCIKILQSFQNNQYILADPNSLNKKNQLLQQLNIRNQ